jgi:hypothetical protein
MSVSEASLINLSFASLFLLVSILFLESIY